VVLFGPVLQGTRQKLSWPKAVAGEGRFPFSRISGSEVRGNVRPVVGASRVRISSSRRKKNAPCIVLHRTKSMLSAASAALVSWW